MDVLDQSPLGPDAVQIVDQQHAKHQLGIDGRAASVVVDRRQLVPDRLEVQQPVDLAPEVIPGDVILDPKPVKQVLLRLQPSHHRPTIPADRPSKSADYAPIKPEFFTSTEHFWH